MSISSASAAPALPGATKKKQQLTSTAAGGAALLIALQIGSRALTFIVNQILLRYLSPDLLGTSTQLEVYSITVLFCARESLRVAVQRESDTADDTFKADDGRVVPAGQVDGRSSAGRTQAIVNLAYISIPLGAIFAVALAWLYVQLLSAKDIVVLEIPYFRASLKIYGLAAFWELLSEPCFVVVQQKSEFKIRTHAELIATLLRCIVTAGSAVWASRVGREIGVLPFALGQSMYAASLILVYYWNVWGIATTCGFSLTPVPIYSSDKSLFLQSYFSRQILTLGASFFVQTLFKLLLTQGDTYLISGLASLAVQGAYALASNYGGLIARLILQPLEEINRNLFGKLLSFGDRSSSKERVMEARKLLLILLRSYILLSIYVVSVGPTIAPLLLKIVAPAQFSENNTGNVLATFCYYIPCLAINGLTEAFVSSAATKSEVDNQTRWMLAFSAGFVGAAFVFLKVLALGAEGLVWANVMNMLFRIIWCTAFIEAYLKRYGSGLEMGTLMPKNISTTAAVATFATLRQFHSTFNGGITDYLKSGVVAVVLAIVLAFTERAHLLECYSRLRSQS